MAVAYSDGDAFQNLVDLYRQRVSTINALVDSILYCFQDFDNYDEKAAKKALRPVALDVFKALHTGFSNLDEWNASGIHRVIEDTTKALDLKMGKVGQPLRVAVTGGSFSPPIDQTVEIIGREKTITRIERAITYISVK